MKAVLTLIYELEGVGDSDVEFLKESVDDWDDQAISEAFAIGWNVPKEREIKFIE